ncbi:MAG: deoxyguanosinetriphosphate triphosphohydrolase family protein [Pseudomonadota bacterium]
MRLYSKNDNNREIPTQHTGSRSRSEFRRDYARLIHSAAFRRLQGKTQLFPGNESDFFRNRLTHSIEVAQIAKGIALKINNENQFFSKQPINLDIVETAGLVHDLGHPPFGHNGEMALDDCMKAHGGFEGNAQTLRIIARLEKKEMYERSPHGISRTGKDNRAGLNLSYRMLAAAVKYDNEIPIRRRKGSKLVKGYYASEAVIIRNIKRNVLGSFARRKLKTVECQIMDIADDIAYSTYDLEDTLKAGFLTPLGMLSTNAELLHRIANKISKSIGGRFTASDVSETLLDIFAGIFSFPKEYAIKDLINLDSKKASALSVTYVSRTSGNLASSGYLRTGFTSQLVNEFINGIEVEVDARCPPLSAVRLSPEVLRKVEVLKHYTYEATIMSPRLKVVQHRGYEIVRTIFEALDGRSDSMGGYLLLPDDFRAVYDAVRSIHDRKRVICDFVAGMTDRYAVEFYSRLKSENAQTIFKPL